MTALDQIVEDGAQPGAFDDLIQSLPKVEAEFTVELMGRPFRFRRYADHGDYARYKRSAAKFAQKMANPKNCPESWRPYHVRDIETLIVVYLLADRSVEPKISQRDGFKLAHSAPMQFEAFAQAVGQQLMPGEAEDMEIEEGKGGSGRTPDSATA